MSDKIAAFNSVAGIYDGWYEHPQGKQVFNAERDAIESMIPAEGLGLEIGAGTGVFAESLTDEDRTILCLDPSAEMLGKARNRDLPCILGLGEPSPIRLGVLDFSYMVTVLEFLDEPVDKFKEVQRIAKQGAWFTMLFINSDSSWGELYRDIGGKGDPVFQYAKLYTLSEVSKLLSKVGYSVVSAIGTLNSDPMNQDVDQDLVEPSEKSGVLIVKSVKKESE